MIKYILALTFSLALINQALAQRVFVTDASTPDWNFGENKALFLLSKDGGIVGEIRNPKTKVVIATTGIISYDPIKVRSIKNSNDILLVTNSEVRGLEKLFKCSFIPDYFCGRVRRPEIFRLSADGVLNKIYSHHTGVFGYYVDATLTKNDELLLLYSTKKGLQLDLIDKGSKIIWSRHVSKAKNGTIFLNSAFFSIISPTAGNDLSPLSHLRINHRGNVIEKKEMRVWGNGTSNLGAPSYLVFEDQDERLIVHGTGHSLAKQNAISIIHIAANGALQTTTFSRKHLSAIGHSCAPEASLSNGYIAIACQTRTKTLEAKLLVGRFKNGTFYYKVITLPSPCRISAELKWSEIAINKYKRQGFHVQWVAYTRESHKDRQPESCSLTKMLQF